MAVTNTAVNATAKSDLTASFSALMGRIQTAIDNGQLTEAQVIAYAINNIASDAEAVDDTITNKFVSPKGAKLVAAAEVAAVVDAAPEALNTLNEIAAALNDNPNQINDILTALDGKAATTYVDSQLALKSDITYVDAQLALKADITYVDAQVSAKADTTYVDAADAVLATDIQTTSDFATSITEAVYVELKAEFDGAFVA